MQIGISTRCFSTPLTVDMLERLRVAGFSRIELHANRHAFDFHDKALVRGVSRWFGENGLPSPSLHLPFEERPARDWQQPLNFADPAPPARMHAMDEIKRCLELAEHLPIAYAVLHLGAAGQRFNPVVFDHAYAAIMTIQSFSGLRVLLENLNSDLSRASRIAEFRSVSQLPHTGFCYDTGHPDAEDIIRSGSPEAIHLNDNNGMDDDHLRPFEGRRNWYRFVEEIVTADFKGPLMLEVEEDDPGKGRECGNRLRDLIDECRHSVEEFRLKYKLPLAAVHEDDR